MKKQPKGKIKNKAMRRVLRQVAQWDNCPTDYQINFKRRLTNITFAAASSIVTIWGTLYLAIYFC